MKLEKPDFTFYSDKNDPNDLGGWTCHWGDLRITLSSEHANADRLYVYLEKSNGDDDETAIIHTDGSIELSAYGINTSFKDLLDAISLRKAVRRVLQSV